ncbi:MAG: sugar-binding protein [bacterium]
MKKLTLILFLFVLSVGVWAMAQASGDSQTQGVYLGIFREGAPRNMNYITKFEEQVGKRPATIMWYQDWSNDFPAEDAQKVVEYGAVPHIVWEAKYWSYPGKITPPDIIAGKWDKYISAWAKGAKAFGQPVFVRIGHEFNTSTYPWGVPNLNKEPETFIKFYRHIVDVFNKEGVKNVKWVWCFNNYSNPAESWNDWTRAYPGDKYVDWIGIDGYNWGNTQSWSGWETFKVLFRDQMRLAHMLWPTKPIMIAEFASTDEGGDKVAWIKDMPEFLKTSMRDIDLIIWFDEQKESDWRIKSDKKTLAAFKSIMEDSLFLSSGESLARHTVAAAAPKKKKTVVAVKAGNVAIDGQLNDWVKQNPITMADESYLKEGTGWAGPKDLSGSTYIMWDEANLYLAAEIEDEMPFVNNKTGRDIWNGDAIEFVIGLKPEAEANRTEMAAGDFQIGLSAGDGKNVPPGIYNWQRRRDPKDSEIAVKKSGTGYILEAKIPWQSVRKDFVAAAGTKIPFDIAFDDADVTTERERQFIWNGDFYFYKDPSVWGILELK